MAQAADTDVRRAADGDTLAGQGASKSNPVRCRWQRQDRSACQRKQPGL